MEPSYLSFQIDTPILMLIIGGPSRDVWVYRWTLVPFSTVKRRAQSKCLMIFSGHAYLTSNEIERSTYLFLSLHIILATTQVFRWLHSKHYMGEDVNLLLGGLRLVKLSNLSQIWFIKLYRMFRLFEQGWKLFGVIKNPTYIGGEETWSLR